MAISEEGRLAAALAKLGGRSEGRATVVPDGNGVAVFVAEKAVGGDGWKTAFTRHPDIGFDAFRQDVSDLGLANVAFLDLKPFTVTSPEGVEWNAAPALYTAWTGPFPEVQDDVVEYARSGMLSGAIVDSGRSEHGSSAETFELGRNDLRNWLDRLSRSSSPEAAAFSEDLRSELHPRRKAVAAPAPEPSEADREALEKLLETVTQESFTHLPYGIMQKLGGETDGGLAAMFDMDCSKRLDSTFMEEVGGDILDLIVKEAGAPVLSHNHPDLFPDFDSLPSDWTMPARPTEDDYREFGRRTAALVVDHVVKAFPEVERAKVEAFTDRLAAFAVSYARHVNEFYWSGMPLEDAVRDRAGPGVRGATEIGGSVYVLLDPTNDVEPGRWVVSGDGTAQGHERMEDAVGAFDSMTEAAQARLAVMKA